MYFQEKEKKETYNHLQRKELYVYNKNKDKVGKGGRFLDIRWWEKGGK